MINQVSLTGRLTSDPELKKSNNGTSYANFTLAVDRKFKNQQTGQYETDFIGCRVWRKTAELLAESTHKGSLIGIEGRIETSNYMGQNGQKIYRTDVVVDNLTFLEPKETNQQGQANYGYSQNGQQAPANNQWYGQQPYGNQAGFNQPVADAFSQPEQPNQLKDAPF